jgi:cytochrome b561
MSMVTHAGKSDMSIFGNERRYGLIAQSLHWTTAVLVVWAWLIAGTWGRDAASSVMTLHQTLGFAVFVLVLVRLVWRAFDRRPEEPAMPGLMSLAGKLSHWLLYGLLVAIPASAMLGSWLQGRSITVYGIGAIGPFLTTSRGLGHQILEIHQLLGTTLILVAGVHAAAAIFHHFFLKDRVLRQMLPVG